MAKPRIGLKKFKAAVRKLRKDNLFDFANTLDLRSNSFEPWQIGLIARANNNLETASTARTVPIRKERGESQSKFKRRVSILKKEIGQSGRVGNFIKVQPGDSKDVIRIEGKNIVIDRTDNKNETFYPINLEQLATLSKPEIKALVAKLKRGFDSLALSHGPFRGKETTSSKGMLDRLLVLLESYKGNKHALSGIWRIKNGSKTPTKRKRKKRKTKKTITKGPYGQKRIKKRSK